MGQPIPLAVAAAVACLAMGAAGASAADAAGTRQVAQAADAGQAAQAAPATETEGARQRAFDAMLADPANLERSFQYVQAATAAGDLRGAIAALERMLRIRPGLANLELELGVLYLRVGATEPAALYLRRALAAPDVPPAVRERAQGLLARAELAQRRHLFSGSLYAGLRWDDNANAGPDSRVVRVLGTEGLLDEEATGQSDGSAELSAAVTYVHAFDNQAGDTFEATASTYHRRYQDRSDVNLNSVALDAGPRFQFGRALQSAWSLRPYVAGAYYLLDDKRYLGSLGIGLNARKAWGATSTAELSLEASDQRYVDSASRPDNSDRSGTLLELRGSASHALTPGLLLSGQASLAHRDARRDYESYEEGALRLGLTWTHAAPFGWTELPWSTSVSAGVRRTRYDDADPAIDPDERRRDTRTELSLSTNVRLSPRLTLVGSLNYADNDSSLPNYRYDNTGVGLGLAWSF